jgi:hypothetical protein
MEVAMLDLAATSMDLHCAVHQLGRVLDDHTIRVDHEADT